MACHELKKQKEKTKEEIKAHFDELRKELDKQEAKMMEEAEQAFNEKDRDLIVAINDLQCQQLGMQTAVKFTTEFLKSGNDLELVLNNEPIKNRFIDLLDEDLLDSDTVFNMASMSFIPSNKPELLQNIQQFGSINQGKGQISPLHSTLEGIEQNLSILAAINSPRSFFVILRDKKGNLIERASKKIKLAVNGPSINTLVRVKQAFKKE